MKVLKAYSLFPTKVDEHNRQLFLFLEEVFPNLLTFNDVHNKVVLHLNIFF